MNIIASIERLQEYFRTTFLSQLFGVSRQTFYSIIGNKTNINDELKKKIILLNKIITDLKSKQIEIGIESLDNWLKEGLREKGISSNKNLDRVSRIKSDLDVYIKHDELLGEKTISKVTIVTKLKDPEFNDKESAVLIKTAYWLKDINVQILDADDFFEQLLSTDRTDEIIICIGGNGNKIIDLYENLTYPIEISYDSAINKPVLRASSNKRLWIIYGENKEDTYLLCKLFVKGYVS